MVTLGWWNDFLSVLLCQPCPPYGLQWAGLRFPGLGGKRRGQAVVKELVYSHQWPLHSGCPSKASIDVFLPVVFQSRKGPPVATRSSALGVRVARQGGTEGRAGREPWHKLLSLVNSALLISPSVLHCKVLSVSTAPLTSCSVFEPKVCEASSTHAWHLLSTQWDSHSILAAHTLLSSQAKRLAVPVLCLLSIWCAHLDCPHIPSPAPLQEWDQSSSPLLQVP